jgi:hypothetical protein
MSLIDLFEQYKDIILLEVTENMERVNLEHYEDDSEEKLRQKMARTYYVFKEAITKESFDPLKNYLERVGEERYASGYELYELQTALNILEECIWKQIDEKLPKKEQLDAFITITKYMSNAKLTLAKIYVFHTEEAQSSA